MVKKLIKLVEFEKETDEIIGTCLIYFNDEENNWDISYNLGKKYWGKGLYYRGNAQGDGICNQCINDQRMYCNSCNGKSRIMTSHSKTWFSL